MVVQRVKNYTQSNSSYFNGLLALGLGILIFVLDWVTGFNGFLITSINWIGWITGLVSIPAIALLTYNFIENFGNRKLLLVSLVYTIILILFGLGNIGSFNSLRLILLYVIFHLFMLPALETEQEKINHHLMFSLLLIVDYVFLGMLELGSSAGTDMVARHYFPIWLVWISLFYAQRTDGFLFKLALIIIVTFGAFAGFGAKELFSPQIQQISAQDRTAFQNMALNYIDAIRAIPGNVRSAWNETVSAVTEPPNTGTVEHVEDPQGVFLSELDKGEYTFRQGQPVYVWALVEGKTLDDQIEGTVECYTEVENEDGEMEVVEGTVDEPDLLIFSGVERSVPCQFSGLPPGEYDVTFRVLFAFSGSARHKVYLMDRERLLDDLAVLRQKGQEASKEAVLSQLYDIQDTDPTATYTSGAVEIGIGTDNVPWDIGQRVTEFKPRFGVTVSSNWERGGELVSVDSLEYIMPSTFDLLTNTCDVSFTGPTSQGDDKVYTMANPVDDPEVVEEGLTINCLMSVDQGSLDPIPVTTRYIRTNVDYTFMLEEGIPITIEESQLAGGDDQNVGTNWVCCERFHDINGEAIYSWESASACESNQFEYRRPVAASNCQVCCQISYQNGPTEYEIMDEPSQCSDLYSAPDVITQTVDMSQC